MKTMQELIAEFPAQLREATEIGSKAEIRPAERPIQRAYVAGMGGSGIGADFVASLVRNECPVPYQTGKGYAVPAWVDEHTLAIASSYSGNTEETLASFNQMLKQGARVVCLASGGSLIEAAEREGLDAIRLPGGSPSPRACLGYSLVQQLWVLHKLGLISDTLPGQVNAAADFLEREQAAIQGRARQLALLLKDRLPVIYVLDRLEPVAVRMRQQINENAKMLCWHHVLPEMNHNELVGWRQAEDRITAVFLRSLADESARNQMRIEITKEVVGNFAGGLVELPARGENLLERSLYLVHLVDWVSVYLAETRGIDPVEIKVIDYLKQTLAGQ